MTQKLNQISLACPKLSIVPACTVWQPLSNAQQNPWRYLAKESLRTTCHRTQIEMHPLTILVVGPLRTLIAHSAIGTSIIDLDNDGMADREVFRIRIYVGKGLHEPALAAGDPNPVRHT